MTDPARIKAKQRQLAKVLAHLAQAEADRARLVSERAQLIRELMELGGHGMGQWIASELGVTRQRVYGMAGQGRTAKEPDQKG